MSHFQFFIFLAFSFLYAAYTANIVSLLQSPSKSIRTVEDLYHSKIKIGLEDVPYNRYYFGVSQIADPFHRKFAAEKISPPGEKDHFVTAAEGVALIRKGLYAFAAESSIIYKHMEDTFYEHEKCDLGQIELIKFYDPHMSLRKRSPIKEILKVK